MLVSMLVPYALPCLQEGCCQSLALYCRIGVLAIGNHTNIKIGMLVLK